MDRETLPCARNELAARFSELCTWPHSRRVCNPLCICKLLKIRVENCVSNKVGSQETAGWLDLSLVVETISHATRLRASTSRSQGSRRFRLGSVGDAILSLRGRW